MKRILITLSCVLFITAILHAQNKTTAPQYANTSLSNLVSPAINVGLIPDKNNNHNIGNSTKAWKNLYLDSNIYVGGTRFISRPVNSSIAIGFNALKKIGKGNANVAIGTNALSLNTSGYGNVAIGSEFDSAALSDNHSK